MGKGRKPTPSHLKVVRGTDRADRRNNAEPQPSKCRPDAPDTMTDVGREAWDYVVGILDRMGILTEADAMAVELQSACGSPPPPSEVEFSINQRESSAVSARSTDKSEA